MFMFSTLRVALGSLGKHAPASPMCLRRIRIVCAEVVASSLHRCSVHEIADVCRVPRRRKRRARYMKVWLDVFRMVDGIASFVERGSIGQVADIVVEVCTWKR